MSDTKFWNNLLLCSLNKFNSIFFYWDFIKSRNFKITDRERTKMFSELLGIVNAPAKRGSMLLIVTVRRVNIVLCCGKKRCSLETSKNRTTKPSSMTTPAQDMILKSKKFNPTSNQRGFVIFKYHCSIFSKSVLEAKKYNINPLGAQ
jgi:hypothetical protein